MSAFASRRANRYIMTVAAGTLLGLLTVSAAAPARADTALSPSASGTYRSSEGATQTARKLGEELSTPLLPDPASALSNRRASDDLDTLLFDDWYEQDVWISDVGLLLYKDFDDDGYHAGFSLTVDADTNYSDTDVYLSISTQRSRGAVENLHTSNVFPLYGRTSADEYQIDIELISNYPTDHYDLIIELRDAYNHQQLDRITSYDFSNLRDLPLESEDHDDRYYEPVDDDPYLPIFNEDVRVTEVAGSFGWLMTLPMIILLFLRRRPVTPQATIGDTTH